MIITRIALALGLLLGASSISYAADAEHPAEPEGFWTGPMQGAVPATISGGTVIGTEDLAALIERGTAILIDVSPAPHLPEELTAEAQEDFLRLMPPHRTIPGSMWLPGVGQGELAPADDAWYRDQLKWRTGGDRNRRIIVFCHPNCWGSWNAAKRAILYGYTQVYWYPDGVEGWQDSGRPTEAVEAQKEPE